MKSNTRELVGANGSLTELPDKLSELIEVALQDLECVEQDSRYTINMAKWHDPKVAYAPPTDDPEQPLACSVCLAGAVIAKRSNIAPTEFVLPALLGPDIKSKLEILDHLRAGQVMNALEESARARARALNTSRVCKPDADREELWDVFGNTYPITPYGDSPDAFKRDMRVLQELLRKYGL